MSFWACGDDGDEARDTGPPAAAPLALADLPGPEQAYGLPADRLESFYERAAETAAENEASAVGVAWARAAAELARIGALRAESDEARVEWLARAREQLTFASRRKALDGACEAALALARLEARDAANLSGAYAVAYRTVRRFDRETDGECVASARRMLAVLDGHRPGSDTLAAIDADPDADDPSAGIPAPGEPASDAVSDWAAGRTDVGRATLERIDVYGAPSPGETDSGVVRVVLGFEGVAVFERGELPAEGEVPRRAFLDVAGTTLAERAPRSVPVGGAGLVRVRAATFEPGTVRVVFDLEPNAHYRLFFLTDPYRIVVDFERGGGVAPVALAGEGRRLRTLVLDPGHGGNDYGARHDGLTEGRLTLDIAQRMAAILERRLPETRVLLTRHRDELLSLERRVAFANSVGADAFVSIHLNAADDPVEHGGVATFVLDTTDDRQAIRLAARENGTTTAEVTGLQRILAGLHRESQVDESRSLAELVQIGTLAGGRRILPDLPDRGVKSAMFYVLVGARMPAILLEASFLTQPEENRALATSRYRQALAEGAAEGIVRWASGS